MRSKSAGFTLLEVLVATTIMAIAVTGLLTTLNTSLRNAAKVTDVDRAALLARQKMNELLVTPEKSLPKNAVIEGAWNPAMTSGLQVGWRAEITDFEKPPGVAPGTQALERIALEVWWIAGGNRRNLHLEGYRAAKIEPPEESQ